MRWLDGVTDSMNMSLNKLRSWWWTGKSGVLESMGLQSWTWLSDWTELKNYKYWMLGHFLWTAPWFFGFGKGLAPIFCQRFFFTTVLIASVLSMIAVSSICRAWCCLWSLPPQRFLAVAEVVSQARKIIQWAALPVPTKPSLSWLFK